MVNFERAALDAEKLPLQVATPLAEKPAIGGEIVRIVILRRACRRQARTCRRREQSPAELLWHSHRAIGSDRRAGYVRVCVRVRPCPGCDERGDWWEGRRWRWRRRRWRRRRRRRSKLGPRVVRRPNTAGRAGARGRAVSTACCRTVHGDEEARRIRITFRFADLGDLSGAVVGARQVVVRVASDVARRAVSPAEVLVV